jgi:hypothetical protein
MTESKKIELTSRIYLSYDFLRIRRFPLSAEPGRSIFENIIKNWFIRFEDIIT